MHSRALAPVLAMMTLGVGFAGCFDWVKDLRSDYAGPGEWHKEFLDDAKYGSLLVEIDYVDGSAPSEAALEMLRTRMGERLSKPNGIEVKLDDKLSAGGGTRSINQVANLEDRHRDFTKGDGRAVLYVLYLDGNYDEDTQESLVLGAAYSGSSIVMFQETIRETAQNLPLLTTPASSIERAVLVHELGHILGLVNNHLPMQRPHEDAASKTHSTNQDSVMYWAVETSNIDLLLRFRTEPPNNFDADDVADMRAAGGT